jgi:DNA-binding NtrC family response regulator
MDGGPRDGGPWGAGPRQAANIPEGLREKLGVLALRLPPLRERREDILPLFRAFVERAAHQAGRQPPFLEHALEKDLLQRAWPGNVRELAWAAYQAFQATPGAILAHPPAEVPPGRAQLVLPMPDPGPLEAMVASTAKAAERELIRRALEVHDRDTAATAAALALSPRTLAQRLKEHHLPLET